MTDLPAIPEQPSQLRQIEVGLAEVAEQAKAIATAGDVDTLLVWLAQAKQLRRIVGDLERELEVHSIGLLPYGLSEHPVVGAVQVRSSKDRKAWKWDDLLTAMWPVLAERNEGDMAAMVTDLLNVVGLTPSKGPRVGPVRDLGLDPDEFCESKPGRLTVQIHGDVS